MSWNILWATLAKGYTYNKIMQCNQKSLNFSSIIRFISTVRYARHTWCSKISHSPNTQSKCKLKYERNNFHNLVLYCHSTKAKANLIYPILRSLHHNTPKSCKQKLQCKRKKIKCLNDTMTILASQESPSKLTCHKIKC